MAGRSFAVLLAAVAHSMEESELRGTKVGGAAAEGRDRMVPDDDDRERVMGEAGPTTEKACTTPKESAKRAEIPAAVSIIRLIVGLIDGGKNVVYIMKDKPNKEEEPSIDLFSFCDH